jgi:urease alpha subunit
MLHNSLSPDIDVDLDTYEVSVDGAIVTSEAVDQVALNRRYVLS